MQAIRTAVGVLSEARQLAEFRGASETSSVDTTPLDSQIDALLRQRDQHMRQAILEELRGGPKVDTEGMSGYELVRAFDPPKPAENRPVSMPAANLNIKA